MDWRVIVVDQKRFCIVGTMDLTFAECRSLSDRMTGNMIRLPERRLAAIGSFEVTPEQAYSVTTVRGQHFYRRDSSGSESSMLHVVIEHDGELDGLRRTGRSRDWDADLREQHSSK